MKHLKYIDDDAITFIKGIISDRSEKEDKKILQEREDVEKNKNPQPKDLIYKERCNSILDKNKQSIDNYDTDFKADKWTKIKPNIPNPTSSEDKDKEDFLKLYKYNNKHIVDFCHKIKEINEGVWMCPICQVTPVNSLDHYIPKDKYPLYAVHPRNLVPCCNTCNGHKSQNVISSIGERIYWNAYIDSVDQRYLYCNITIDNGNIPICNFSINQGELDDTLYNRIKKTFEDLCVDQTMQHGASNYVTKLKDTMVTHLVNGNYNSIDECVNAIRSSIRILDQNDNNNDVERIARLALLDSPEFLKLVEDIANRQKMLIHNSDD